MLLNVALFLLSVVVSKNHLFLVDDLVLSFFWGLLKPGLSPWLKKSQIFLQSLYLDLETHPRIITFLFLLANVCSFFERFSFACLAHLLN